MHFRNAFSYPVPCLAWRLIVTGTFWTCGELKAIAAEPAKSIWLVSNGFHSSIALRASDLPFSREITRDRDVDAVLIGWGASDYYRGRVNPWTFCKALCGGSPSILHVVPIRGAVANRFPRSDVIHLRITAGNLRRLIRELDQAFARDARGRPIFVFPGYYAESRFYAGTERFYFPKMCNSWVAQKLRACGVPICVPPAIVAGCLVRQMEQIGRRQQWRRRPLDVL